MTNSPGRTKKTRADRQAARKRDGQVHLAATKQDEAILTDMLRAIVGRAHELYGPEPEDGYSERQIVECARQLESEEWASFAASGELGQRSLT